MLADLLLISIISTKWKSLRFFNESFYIYFKCSLIDNIVLFFLDIFDGLLKETRKIGVFFELRAGEIKHQVVNVSKPWNQETWKQVKRDKKEKPKLHVLILETSNENN